MLQRTDLHLTQTQLAAIAHIEKYAIAQSLKAHQLIEEVRAMSNISQADLDQAIDQIKTRARVALHFHPDRLNERHQPVAESLLQDGFYRNQFETKLSNGMLAPSIGGKRDSWENTLFGGAFSSAQIPFADRPKYGAFDLMRHPDGPSPRFGSCYFILHPSASRRSTFTYLDSHRNPDEKGTIQVFEPILAALLTECFEREYALGEKNIMPSTLIQHLIQHLRSPYPDPSTRQPARNLNHYIEAQVHGPIQLKTDVDLLVADPCFQADTIGELLEQLCKRYDIRLLWHGGFSMPVSEVPANFRGPAMPSLAERISTSGWLNTRMIGQAAAELTRNPERWADRGPYEHCLQELKLLWHVLVQYGSPLQTAANESKQNS